MLVIQQTSKCVVDITSRSTHLGGYFSEHIVQDLEKRHAIKAIKSVSNDAGVRTLFDHHHLREKSMLLLPMNKTLRDEREAFAERGSVERIHDDACVVAHAVRGEQDARVCVRVEDCVCVWKKVGQ